MGRKLKLHNITIRIDAETDREVDDAVHRDGAEDRSQWLRGVMARAISDSKARAATGAHSRGLEPATGGKG